MLIFLCLFDVYNTIQYFDVYVIAICSWRIIIKNKLWLITDEVPKVHRVVNTLITEYIAQRTSHWIFNMPISAAWCTSMVLLGLKIGIFNILM